MGKTDDDDTVYCDVQMPLAQGLELLQLVSTLIEPNTHPTLNRILGRMQCALTCRQPTSLALIEANQTDVRQIDDE